MTMQENLIGELEAALAGKNIGYRAVVLRRVADLFVASSGRLSEAHLALFDDVMNELVDEIEVSARAAFGRVLAAAPAAPPKVLRRLALDDVIDVAGPILSTCGRLDEGTLVEGAKTKSQAHLLAISRRETLLPCVTDILVDRGNEEVVLRTAKNPGAAFSEFGYSTLVHRSSAGDELATCIWARPGIPRHHLVQIFAAASESLKTRLTSLEPGKAKLLGEVVEQAANEVQRQARESSSDYAAAHSSVLALHRSGSLGEAELAGFARARKFDETAVSLSILCDLRLELVERALVNVRPEQILVMSRAIGLSWETAKSILSLREKSSDDARRDLDQCCETFARLQIETAKKALQFFRLRERSAASRAN